MGLDAPAGTILLYYVGKVSRTPTAQSLPICVAWGKQFFVEGGPGVKSPFAETFVPAWHVPLATKKGTERRA